MRKRETEYFKNDGFGWKCKSCETEFEDRKGESEKEVSRLMREGEAESKSPKLSTTALAKWADAEHNTLMCPRCGNKEQIKH